MSKVDPLLTLASGSSASAKHVASKIFFSGVRVGSIRQIAMLIDLAPEGNQVMPAMLIRNAYDDVYERFDWPFRPVANDKWSAI